MSKIFITLRNYYEYNYTTEVLRLIKYEGFIEPVDVYSTTDYK